MTGMTVEGQTLTFSIPEAEADVQVIFEGEGFTGSMIGMMGEAGIIGTRRREG